MKRMLISVMAIALIAALSAPAYAAFTPSAEGKPAPELVRDNGSVGQIVNAKGEVVKELDSKELRITSVAQKNSAPSPEVKEQLADAQEQIKDSARLDELTGQLRNALNAAKQSSNDPAIKNATLEDLIVSDLFDSSYVVNGVVTPIPKGDRISFTIKTTLTKDDLYFVLHNIEGDVWEVVEDTELADNGDLTITVDSLSPFAIVVEKNAYAANTPAGSGEGGSSSTTPVSPKTGEVTNYAYLAGTVALLACAAFLCMKGTKRSEA